MGRVSIALQSRCFLKDVPGHILLHMFHFEGPRLEGIYSGQHQVEYALVLARFVMTEWRSFALCRIDKEITETEI